MLSITAADGTALGALAFTIERGVDSEKVSIRITNTGGSDVSGAWMAMFAEIGGAGSGDFRSAGHPAVDEIMGRFQVTGQDSSATPGQEIILDVVQPLGYLATAILPNIKPGNWIIADVWMKQAGESAGTGSVNVQIRVVGDAPARPLPLGLTAVARGVLNDSNDGQTFLVSGREVTATGTPDDQVHAAAGVWVMADWGEITDGGIQDVTLDQDDVAPVALGVGESYWAAITQSASSTPTVTKGAKDTTPIKPTPPPGELILAFVQVRYGAGGSVILTGDITSDLTYGRLWAEAGTGLHLVLHAGQSMTANFLQTHAVKETLALTGSTTNYLWMTPAGAPIVNTASWPPPVPGALLLWDAVTDGAGITALNDDRVFVG